MTYTTITRMSFKLPEEYDWSLKVEQTFKNRGSTVKVYDNSTIVRTLEVTETYEMNEYKQEE